MHSPISEMDRFEFGPAQAHTEYSVRILDLIHVADMIGTSQHAKGWPLR